MIDSHLMTYLVDLSRHTHIYIYLKINNISIYLSALLRRTIVTLNRTYGTHRNLSISLFLLTIFGPIYSGPP